MNRTYALVWNLSLGVWSVTDEHARRRAKGAGAVLATALLLPLTAIAADLPTGGQVVSGSGQIGTPSNNQMIIDQASNKLAIDWQSFDIGAGNRVTFNQPGTDAIALNRVLGADGSKIMGQLDANGRVFIINPNGVLFGAGAQVNVGGLVASTLDISNSDFEAGHYRFKGDGSNASVVNNGTLSAAAGGSVALLGGTVSNNGVIVANQGTVALAAGNAMTLDFAGDGLLNVQVDEAVVDALVENHQLIRANGGQVLLTANAGEALLNTVVNNTGLIEARTVGEKNGKIVLLGNFDGGTVQVAGTLDASAPTGGNGGFIDTSGAHVKVANSAKVTTKAANGKTGTWLIDPTDIRIVSGADNNSLTGNPATSSASQITNGTLQAALGNTNVTLTTADDGNEAGDIHVDAAVSWNADTTLTLNAHRTININAAITATGKNAGLALSHGGYTQNNGSVASGSDYNVKAPITLSGANATFSVNGNAYTLIHSMADLRAINYNMGGQYALAQNLEASGTTYTSPLIGPYGIKFTGTFAGLGHTISNLTISAGGTSWVGLFGFTSSDSVIRDLGMLDVHTTGFNWVGGLAGYNLGSITNAYATGSVSGSSFVGGLVGLNAGNITKAYATDSVTGGASVGGLVGHNDRTINNAYATGSVAGNYNVGGLVGNNESNITNAYATGSVTGSNTDSYIGGLAGQNAGNITNAYATGKVTGNYKVGGLVGASYGTISNAYWDKDTTGQASSHSSDASFGKTTAEMQNQAIYAGWNFDSTWRISATGAGTDGYAFYGLPTLQGVTRKKDYQYFDSGLGTQASPWTLTNWQQLQNINFSATTLAGYYKLTADLDKNSYGYTTNASATANGGAGWKTIGDNSDNSNATRFSGTFNGQGHTVSDLVIKQINNTATTTFVGMFGLTTSTAQIKQVGLINAGITLSTNAPTLGAGLLVGLNEGMITESYATGSVSVSTTFANPGDIVVGGLVGNNQPSGVIKQSYASATVSGPIAGGLVGTSWGLIEQSYASSTVTGSSTKAGGLVGYASSLAGGRINSSFWDQTAWHGNGCGSGACSGVTGKTTVELQQLQTFTDAGWDIDDQGGTGKAWRIYEGQTSPLLRGLLKQVTVTADEGITGKTYDGTAASGTATYSTSVPGAALNGSLSYTTTSKNADTYSTADGSLTINYGLHSGQQGYDISYARKDASLAINKAALTVTANNASKTYDGQAFSGGNGVRYTGFVNNETETVLGGTLTYGGTAQGAIHAGTYGLSASGLTSDNYTLSYTDGSLTVDKASLTVTANNASKTYDGQAFSGGNGVRYTGFVNNETETVLGGTLTYGGTAQGAMNAGTYGLSASGLTANNYDIQYEEGTLQVTAAAVAPPPPNANSTTLPYASVLASNGHTVSAESKQQAQESEALSQDMLVTNPLADALNLHVINHGIRLPEGI